MSEPEKVPDTPAKIAHDGELNTGVDGPSPAGDTSEKLEMAENSGSTSSPAKTQSTATPETIDLGPSHDPPSHRGSISSSTQPQALSQSQIKPSPIPRRVSASDQDLTTLPPLHHPMPTKPRSNSALQSSRPAPPSPAPSRPVSQIGGPNSPNLSAVGSPHLPPSSPGKPNSIRDRASSTSSSRVGRSGSLSTPNATPGQGSGVTRRPSGSNQRGSSRTRPKSGLGSSFFGPDQTPSQSSNEASPSPGTPINPTGLPDSALGGSTAVFSLGSGPSSASSGTPISALGESSLASTAIPEHPSPKSLSSAPDNSDDTDPKASTKGQDNQDLSKSQETAVPEKPEIPREGIIIIRDYAFDPSDSRFKGPGLPLVAPEGEGSRRTSRWFGSDSSDSSSKKGSGGSGWSGFGLLSWRGFMRNRRDSTDSPGDGETSGNLEEEEYRIQPDHDQDDYAFSSDSGLDDEDDERRIGVEGEDGEGEEPWGLYRAIYAFEAVGEHEIELEEGDLVDLRGRGGGDGWVVGVKMLLNPEGKLVPFDNPSAQLQSNPKDTQSGSTPKAGEGIGVNGEGLVPESYLEKVSLDILLRERKEQEMYKGNLHGSGGHDLGSEVIMEDEEDSPGPALARVKDT